MAGLDWRKARTYKGGSVQVEIDEKKRPDAYWRNEHAAPRTHVGQYITAAKSDVYHLSLSGKPGNNATLCKAQHSKAWKYGKHISDKAPFAGKRLCTMCRAVAEKKGIVHAAD